MRWTKASASFSNGNCAEVTWWVKAKKSNPNGECAETAWTKSSASESAACVQAAALPDGGVLLRNSRYPDGDMLAFTPGEWDAFLDGAGKGEFTLDRLRHIAETAT